MTTVQYFANDASIGLVTNTGGVLYTNTTTGNPFYIVWSNVMTGSYTLRARRPTSRDSYRHLRAGQHITAVTSAPPPPPPTTNILVSIYATDPLVAASKARTAVCWYSPDIAHHELLCSGTNTATFVVVRDGATNYSLTVPYHIGGTASNGVDYIAIGDSITIPAGQRYAKITIDPLEDVDPTNPAL